jgi:hypothetical protein
MSNLTVKGNASGTGTVILEAPNTNSNRTITLPDSTSTLATTTDSITQTQLATALNASGSAPIYACRAWVNFNGTGTVAIRASGNVSSITDNGAGNYTVNFTTAMPDANFVTVMSAMTSDTLGGVRFNGAGGTTTSSVNVYCTSDARAGADASLINVAVFR